MNSGVFLWFPYGFPNIFRDGSAIEVYTTPDPKVEIIAVAFTQLTLRDFAGFEAIFVGKIR